MLLEIKRRWRRKVDVDGGVGEGGVEFKVWNHGIGMFGEITRPDPFFMLGPFGSRFFLGLTFCIIASFI